VLRSIIIAGIERHRIFFRAPFQAMSDDEVQVRSENKLKVLSTIVAGPETENGYSLGSVVGWLGCRG
jgi:hypothetical protein